MYCRFTCFYIEIAHSNFTFCGAYTLSFFGASDNFSKTGAALVFIFIIYYIFCNVRFPPDLLKLDFDDVLFVSEGWCEVF